MRRHLLVATAVAVAAGALLPWADRIAAQSATGQPPSPQASASLRVPVFELDASWPRLPNNWVLGQTPGVAVDRHDHIWVLHRPRTVPEADRAKAAPPLLEFDADGTFLRGWGGPGSGEPGEGHDRTS